MSGGAVFATTVKPCTSCLAFGSRQRNWPLCWCWSGAWHSSRSGFYQMPWAPPESVIRMTFRYRYRCATVRPTVSGSVPAADWFAFVALRFFPVTSKGDRLLTTSIKGGEGQGAPTERQRHPQPAGMAWPAHKKLRDTSGSGGHRGCLRSSDSSFGSRWLRIVYAREHRLNTYRNLACCKQATERGFLTQRGTDQTRRCDGNRCAP